MQSNKYDKLALLLISIKQLNEFNRYWNRKRTCKV